MRQWKVDILFVVLIIATSVFYNYPEIVFKRPQSIHQWRQSDCASLALNYYQNGMDFAHPQTHNLTSDQGTTSYNAPSELPILYYFVAGLYHIFGYNDAIYRIVNTLLFLTGIFFLYRIFTLFKVSTFWSMALSLLFFTSPILVFYGNNFLTNSTALAFVLMGWYYFLRFTQSKKYSSYLMGMLLLLIAASLKITALFSVFAIATLMIAENLGLRLLPGNEKLFHQKWRFVPPIIASILVPGIWILYARYFNTSHDTTYFSTTIFPIWNFSFAEIREILIQIKTLWLSSYFHPSVLIGLAFIALIWTFSYFRSNRILWLAGWVISVEVLAYVALQFWTFADHDYYTINMYILPILWVIGMAELAQTHYPKWMNSPWVMGFFSVFLVFNIYSTRQKMEERYSGWMTNFEETSAWHSITPKLRELGITAQDKVISIPDYSHASLYLMNQKGWTEYTDYHFNSGKKTRYNQDAAGIQKSIENGAKFLIIYGVQQLYEKPYLQNFTHYLLGSYQDVLIFDVTRSETNFSLGNQEIIQHYYCSADSVNENGNYFWSESGLFQNINNQSSTYSQSGKYSVEVHSQVPYGMTLEIDNVQFGESFQISYWAKKTNPESAQLIASSEPNLFYYSESTVLETDSSNWQIREMNFFIPYSIQNQTLKVYFYNPEETPAYFDDLEILRFESYLNLKSSEK